MSEIIICSNCQRKLQVPDQYLGQTVQCPDCRHMFVASATAVSAAPAPPPASPNAERAASPSKPRRYEDDEDDHPRSRRRRFEDDDEDDFDGALHLRHRYPPHRGGLILALGLISLIGGWMFCLPVVVGPFAWIMGSTDLRAMRAGQMDPSGEGMTRTGQVCGIIATVVVVAGAVLTIFLLLAAVVGGH